MIRCNLSILLAERNLKITKVSNDTGISRTTLTALLYNRSQGIQFDTINTLCNYLQISPNELILFVPIEIEINHLNSECIDNDEKYPCFSIELKITQNNISHYCQLDCECIFDYDDENKLKAFTIMAHLPDENIQLDEELKNNMIKENEFLKNVISTIPQIFLSDIEDDITQEIFNIYQIKIKDNFDDCLDNNGTFFFQWDNKLRP